MMMILYLDLEAVVEVINGDNDEAVNKVDDDKISWVSFFFIE